MTTNGYDAIVIGGGHNGLVTAAYLGRAGLRTVVLERRDTVGGAAATSELAPGARVPTLAHTVGRLRPSVVRELGLKRHGLSLVGPDVRAFVPGSDGGSITLWSDPARTAEGLRARSAKDAEAYTGFDRLVRSLSGFLGEIAARTPPDIESPGLGDAIAGLQLGRVFRGLGKRDGRTITRVLPMAVADFVAEWFETDALQAALAWRGIQYTAMGPWSAGTTAVLLAEFRGERWWRGWADGLRAGRSGGVERGPRGRGPVGRRRDPDRHGGPLDHVAWRASHRRRSRRRHGARCSRDRRRHRSEGGPDAARRPGGHRSEPALASRQHPDAGDGIQGQSRPVRDAQVHRRRR